MSTKKVSTKTKGIVAAVAGGALLLGSGATFARWSDDAQIGGTTITAGGLEVTAESALQWKYFSHASQWVDIDVPTLRLSPGMTVQGTTSTAAVLDGTDLRATLTVSGGALSGDYASQFDVTWLVDGEPVGTGLTTTLESNKTSAITVEIHWDDTQNHNDGKLSELNLAAMNIRLEQILHPTPAP